MLIETKDRKWCQQILTSPEYDVLCGMGRLERRTKKEPQESSRSALGCTKTTKSRDVGIAVFDFGRILVMMLASLAGADGDGLGKGGDGNKHEGYEAEDKPRAWKADECTCLEEARGRAVHREEREREQHASRQEREKCDEDQISTQAAGARQPPVLERSQATRADEQYQGEERAAGEGHQFPDRNVLGRASAGGGGDGQRTGA